MILISAQEKYLSYRGDAEYAMRLVDSLHDAYQLASEKGGDEMPKMLSDFVFNIEVALQNAGILDQDFNLLATGEDKYVHCLKCDHVWNESQSPDVCAHCGNTDMQQTVYQLAPTEER